MACKLLLSVLVFLVIQGNLYSQKVQRIDIEEDRLPAYGIFGSYNFISYKTDITQVPGVPNCCPEFIDGKGNSFSGGLSFEYPLLNFELFKLKTNLMFNIKGGVSGYTGQLKASEEDYIILHDQPAKVGISHNIDTRIYAFSLEPSFKYRIFKGFSISAGVNAGYVIVKRFSQAEVMVTPENEGTFENGTRSRNEESGVIADVTKILYHATGGLHYEIPLNSKGTVWAEPEVFYSYQLNSFLQSDKWKINAIRAGLTVKYMPERSLATPLVPEK